MTTFTLFLELIAPAGGALIPLFVILRDRRARARAKAKADLSDAVLDEESLPVFARISWAEPKPDATWVARMRDIAQAEREIVWAVGELAKSSPEAEPVWINALRIGGKRLERLRQMPFKAGRSAAPPPRAACTEASPPSHP